MERGSDRHSQRIDDEMARETESLTTGSPVESRTEGHRMQEGMTEFDPDASPGARIDLPDADDPMPMPQEMIDLRSELASNLAGVQFPADRNTLVQQATSQFARGDIVDRLKNLPEGHNFENVQAIWEAMGGPSEPTHT